VTTTLRPATVADWRAWLARNAEADHPAAEVWLVLPHRGAGPPGLRHHEAVEEALCHGWIDGTQRRHDDDHARQRFTPRRPGSPWSPLNRRRVARLVEEGRMTRHGRAVVDRARADGSWDLVPDGDDLPADLADGLAGDPAADRAFRAFPPSSQRLIVRWILTARRAGTRRRRVDEAVGLAAAGLRAHHPPERGGPPRPHRA